MNQQAHRKYWLHLAAVALFALFALFAWASASALLRQERLKLTDAAGEAIAVMMDEDDAKLREAFTAAENAVLYFSSVPPIDGIGRALAGGGYDTLGASSLEAWRQRLEQIAAAYVESHPKTFQLRLIGLSDNGRELVRVVRDGDGKVRVDAEGDLQQKGDRPYFTEAVRLPEGRVYFSPVDLNQEQGQIEQPPRPTLRAAVPVRDVNGEVFGVMVVNMLAQPLLDALGKSSLPDVQEYVTDAAGHYLWHPQPGRAFAHELAPPGATWQEEFTAQPGVLEAWGVTPKAQQAAMRAPDGADLLVLTRTLRGKDATGGSGLMLHAAIPFQVLDARAWEAIRTELLLVWSEGLVVLGLLTFMLVRWRGERRDLGVEGPGATPGRVLRLFGVEIPLTPVIRRSSVRVLLAALLPVPFWGAVTLLVGQPVAHPYISMLIPVLLASWWGGLHAGLGATLLAVAGVFDLETPAVLDWTDILHLDIWAGTTLLVTGILISFLQANLLWRGAQLVAQQRAQRETERRLVEQAPTGLAMFDTEMRYLASSQRWKTDYRLDEGLDLTGRSYYEVFPETVERWKAVHRRVLAGEILSASEDRFERADGSVQWVTWVCKPWRAPDGTIGGLILWAEDVTQVVEERTAAETALRESESKFRDLWESNRDAQDLCFPPEWKLANGNAAAVALFGARDRQHLASLSPADLSPERQPDGELSATKARQQLEQALRDGSAFFEWTHRRLDGREIPCEVLLTRITLSGQTGVQATIRDVTARKEAEAARDELLAGTNDLIQRVGLDGRLIYVNDAWCRTLGYSPAEALELNVFQVIHPDWVAHCSAVLQALRETDAPVKLETDVVTKDGRTLSLEGDAVVWKDQKGQFSTRGIFRDVTARRRAEERFRDLLEAAPDAMVIIDVAGCMVLVNGQAERLFGYAREELLQQPVEMLVPEALRSRHVAHRRGYVGDPRVRPMGTGLELMGRHKDGREFPVEISLSPLHTEEGTLVSSAIRDVTARKEAEAVRNQLYREKIEALERLRELEGRVLQSSEREQLRIGRDLHDGLGPHLAAMGYAASFLATELRERDPAAAARAEEFREMASHAVSLTRGLARGICPVQVDSGGLSSALGDLARTTSSLTGVSVSCVEVGDPQVTDPGQGGHLYRIAQEALNNAITHGRARNVTIALQQDADRLRLSVADDGCGMFQPADGSTGMGLDSMKYRAQALGGQLTIDSRPGDGTTVSCDIPRQPPKVVPPAT